MNTDPNQGALNPPPNNVGMQAPMQQAPMQQAPMQQVPQQQAPMQQAMVVPTQINMPALSEDLAAQLTGVDTGVKGSSDALPRLVMKQDVIMFHKSGAKTSLGNVTEAVLLGATGIVARTLTLSAYDPNNPSPPDCYASDGKVPNHAYAGTPVIQDRGTGQARKVNTCSECPLGQKGGKCDWVENTVWSFPDLQEGSMFHLPMKNTSLFNKGDLVGNDPNQNTGYLDYASRLNAISTPSGKLKPFQIKTRISVMKQMEQGNAMVFGLATDPTSGQIATLGEDQVRQALGLLQTNTYKELLASEYKPDDPAVPLQQIEAPVQQVPQQQVPQQQVPQQQVPQQQVPQQQVPQQQVPVDQINFTVPQQ